MVDRRWPQMPRVRTLRRPWDWPAGKIRVVPLVASARGV